MTSVASWLPFVRATAIGWLPLVKHPMPRLQLKGRESRADTKIKINVSGQRYETWRHTLEKFPDSLLGSDEREYFYDPVVDEYFFDRDPDLFRYILAYYRTGKVHYPKRACPDEFEQELAFFGLVAADAMGDCCYEEFKDRKKDCLEMNASEGSGKDELQPPPREASVRQKMWHAFEYPNSSTNGLVLYYVTGFFIASSVLTNVLETVPCPNLSGSIEDKENTSCGERFEKELFCVDTSCVLIFSIEYILRLFSSPDRMKHMTSVMSVIDVVAILPYYISLGLPDNKELSGAFVTLRVFRVFRVFKFSRHSQGLRILGYTLQSCARELGFLLFSLSMAVVIFATVVFYTERNVPNTKFTSIPEAFWYTIVTMTTLGYGDMVPQSVAGKLVGGICSLSGVLVIALPVPVIVSNFSRIYQQSQSSDKRDSHKKARLQQEKHIKEGALKKFLNTKQQINETMAILEHHQKQQQQMKQENNSLQVPGNSHFLSFLPAPGFDSFQLQHHHLLLCLEKITGTEISADEQSRTTFPHQGSTSQSILHSERTKSKCCSCLPFISTLSEGSERIESKSNILHRTCKSRTLGKHVERETLKSKSKPSRRSDLNFEDTTNAHEESNPLIVLSSNIDGQEQVEYFPIHGNNMETSFHLSTNSSTIEGVEKSHSTSTSVLEVC